MGKKSRRCKSKTSRARHTRKRQRFGGGIATAKTFFHKNIKTKYSNIVDDEYLRRIQGVVFPSMEDVQMYDATQVETNFESILAKIIAITDNKDFIDFVMQMYLTGNMGLPNSMENVGRLIDSAKKFNVLKQNRMNNGKQLTLTDFPSLSALEQFIHDKQDTFKKIEEKKTKRSNTSAVQKRLREEGEDDVEVVLETPNYIVYHPTTEAGSKFYGRNTQWCTAAETHNMFCHYNEDGNLYIIQNKINVMDKTQFHPKTMQFMNSHDEKVSAEKINTLFQDAELKRWFKDTTLLMLSTVLDVNDPLFFAIYKTKNKTKNGFNIDLFNALFNLDEMPKEMDEIKRRLLKNDVNFAHIISVLSNIEFDAMFKDASFRERFMQLKNVHTNTPWFFSYKLRQYYPDYFDDEETMFATLTTPHCPAGHFEILSNRLKRDFEFVKRLVSAEYEEDDDETKYCRQARRLLLEEEKAELDNLCNEIRKEKERDW